VLVASACATLGVVLAVAAASRPYADNQRNWLVLLAVALLAGAGLIALGTVLGGPRLLVGRFRAGAEVLRHEWRGD